MYDPLMVNNLRPLHEDVIVADMHFAERLTNGGIVLRGDNGKIEGVRPRWGRVYAVGPAQREVQTGQWVLVAHGRWTRGVDIVDSTGAKHTVRKIDINDILCVSDEAVHDEFVKDGI